MKSYKDILYRQTELKVRRQELVENLRDAGDRRDSDDVEYISQEIDEIDSQLFLLEWILE